MHTSLTVSAYVGIRKGCPMTYSINSDNQIEFSFGGARDGFDFSFDAEALKELLKLGDEAIAELGARTVHGEAHRSGNVDGPRQISGDNSQMEQK